VPPKFLKTRARRIWNQDEFGVCARDAPLEISGVNSNAGRSAALGGVLGGLLFLLNPSSLMISLPWIGFLFWRTKRASRPVSKHPVIVLATLGAVAFVWCARNIMGRFRRPQAPIEYAMACYRSLSY